MNRYILLLLSAVSALSYTMEKDVDTESHRKQKKLEILKLVRPQGHFKLLPAELIGELGKFYTCSDYDNLSEAEKKEYKPNIVPLMLSIIHNKSDDLENQLKNLSSKLCTALINTGLSQAYLHAFSSILFPVNAVEDWDNISPFGLAVLLSIYDNKCIKILHRYGGYINEACNKIGYTPLHLACKHISGPLSEILRKYQNGKLILGPKFEYLISHGADINHSDNTYQFSPLHVASEPEVVEFLLKNKADIYSRSKEDKLTPVEEYCMLKCATPTLSMILKKIEILLRHGYDPNSVNMWGNNLMHHFLLYKHQNSLTKNSWDISYGCKIIELLCDYGLDITKVYSNNEDNYFVGAIENFEPDFALCLLAQGAPATIKPLNYFNPQANQPTKIYNYISRLPIATSYKEFLHCLIIQQSSLHPFIINEITPEFLTQTDEQGYTPLHWAVIRGNKKAVEELLTKYPVHVQKEKNIWSWPFGKKEKLPTIDCQDKRGRTPLMWAARLGYKDIYNLLLKNNADRMIRDNQGKIAFNHACDCQRLDIIHDMMLENPVVFELLQEEDKANFTLSRRFA